MNYLKELNAFRDWVVLNRLSTGQIALWHSLMMLCNKFGWPSQFTVSNQVLQLMTGLSRQGLEKARNQLQQKGRIQYAKGYSNQAGNYQLIYFFSFSSDSQKVGTEIDTEGVTEGARKEAQEGRESSTLFKPKTETETERDLTPNPDVRRLLDDYVRLFGFVFQKPPVVNGGKDGKLIKDLLKVYDYDTVKELLNDFFVTEDKFIKGSDYTIGVFYSQVNRLLKEKSVSSKKEGSKYSGLSLC